MIRVFVVMCICSILLISMHSAVAQNASEYIKSGEAKYSRGEYSKALEDYNKAIQLDPDAASYYSSRAVVRYRLGDSKGAIQDANKAVELEPNAPDYYYKRAIYKASTGDFKGAIKDFDKSIELKDRPEHKIWSDQNSHRVFFLMGNAKLELGDYKGAVIYYDKSIELGFNKPYFNRAIAKGKLDDFSGAIESWDQHIIYFPSDAQAYYYRGLNKLKIDQDSACIDLSKAEEMGKKEASDFIKKYCK